MWKRVFFIGFITLICCYSFSFAQHGAWEGCTLGKGFSSGISVKVNLNTASIEDLEKVPGVNHSLARNIVKYRSHHGSFQNVEDLLKVKGITPKTFSRIAPHVYVGKGIRR